MSEKVKIVEVGPRDGLQNEPQFLPTAKKLELIRLLKTAGLQTIEATSFVSPRWVPQMADHSVLMQTLALDPAIQNYPVLVPNKKGLDNAIAAGAKYIAVFTAASESFNKKNINCSIQESLNQIKDLLKTAKQYQLRVRAYVSCVIACPYEGFIPATSVLPIVDTLYTLGCEEISLGDTVGMGTPNKITTLLKVLTNTVPIDILAIHCHDTYGQAIANIYAALCAGVRTIDSAIAGLGGCPYAKGATGNVATEDVYYLLEGLGITTGIDASALRAASRYICDTLERVPTSKVALAWANQSC